jgi:hypothetical protein
VSNTAQGGSDGIVAAGPSNKFDGATSAPGVDGCSDLNFGAIAPDRTQDAPVKATSWPLGRVPD